MKTIPLFALLIVAQAAWAQEPLQVSAVFDHYKKDKTMTLVELSGELLKDYHYERFRSLTVKNNAPAIAHITACIASDQRQARKIKEVVVGGKTTTIYLELPPLEAKSRLILFKSASDDSGTLIYIESFSSADEILQPILQKK